MIDPIHIHRETLRVYLSEQRYTVVLMMDGRGRWTHGPIRVLHPLTTDVTYEYDLIGGEVKARSRSKLLTRLMKIIADDSRALTVER